MVYLQFFPFDPDFHALHDRVDDLAMSEQLDMSDQAQRITALSP